MLTPNGTLNNANGAQRPPLETRIRVTLTALAAVAFLVNLVASHRSTLKTDSFIVYTVGGLLAFVLLMRRFHRLYRSPQQREQLTDQATIVSTLMGWNHHHENRAQNHRQSVQPQRGRSAGRAYLAHMRSECAAHVLHMRPLCGAY